MINIEFNKKNKKLKKIKKIKNDNIKLLNKIENNKITNNNLTEKINILQSKCDCTQKHLKTHELKFILEKKKFENIIEKMKYDISINKKYLDYYMTKVEEFENLINNIDTSSNVIKIDNNIDCVFCLEKINYGITTSCKHSFHYTCFNLYLHSLLNNSDDIMIKCPICRNFI